jgi:hypothetical protein
MSSSPKLHHLERFCKELREFRRASGYFFSQRCSGVQARKFP